MMGFKRTKWRLVWDKKSDRTDPRSYIKAQIQFKSDQDSGEASARYVTTFRFRNTLGFI
jgi:hypothetical protein